MKSKINDKQIINYWLKVYFDLSEGYVMAAINRAYRDFSRTLTIKNFPIDKNERIALRTNWINKLTPKLKVLLTTKFGDQEEFTLWHRSICMDLRLVNATYLLSQGQAQKWVNMTLKYLFAMGENKVPGISSNYQYFHIPLDNIIMNKLKEKGLERFDGVWSKLDDYDTYDRYQGEIRKLFKGQIPMDVEFELFNEIILKQQ